MIGKGFSASSLFANYNFTLRFMKNDYNQEIERIFLHHFDEIWTETVMKYDCNQAQLSEGSRLRPLMVLWGYLYTVKSFERADMQYISSIAVSIELLHKATVILDDWIDNDAARHGKEAFHITYDPYLTVILALHMVSDAILRLKELLPTDSRLPNNYNVCSNLIVQTIYAMSKGALMELKLGDHIFDLERIRLIAHLETAEILGNAMQLGYLAGSGNDSEVSSLFKHTGDRFGYLFQAMNDLEAFTDMKTLARHKGKLNNDINISRKNIAVSMLYNIANPKDKKIIECREANKLCSLMKKYKILETVIAETELFYKKIPEHFRELSITRQSQNWLTEFILFVERMKQRAYAKLGLESNYSGSLK